MTIGGMTIMWAMPTATAEQWGILAIVVATPVLGAVGEHVVRRLLRWLSSGGA